MLIRSNCKMLFIITALILTIVIFVILVEFLQSVQLQDEERFSTTSLFNIPAYFKYSEKYHLYTVYDKPVIWLYHHNGNLSTWLLASILTIHCHNKDDFHIVLVTARSIHAMLQDVHPAFELLLPAHQADYFRARILGIVSILFFFCGNILLKRRIRWHIHRLGCYRNKVLEALSRAFNQLRSRLLLVVVRERSSERR